MKTYQLINKEAGYCESIFVKSNEYDLSLKGILLEANSWSIVDKSVVNCSFIASLCIKWDGCSHFWFKGEDYLNDSEHEDDEDSYYHICGFNSYIEHFRSMIFAWKLAEENIDKIDWIETKEYNQFKSQMNLLDGYEIKEVELYDDSEIYPYVEKLLRGE